MTDSRILMGIMQNDERVWRFICRNMRPGFASIVSQSFPFFRFTPEDIDDIFQEALVILMQKVKAGGVTASREGAVFSYLVQVGKLTASNFVRKKHNPAPEEVVTITHNLHKEDEDYDMPVDEKQLAQNEFLDRAFDSLPDTCKTIFKNFYWERKSMDEIADIIGYNNADSVKTKKNKCMNKFKEFAKKLLESDEFAEEAVRASVERAALRELIEQERIYAESDVVMAADDSAKDEDNDRED
jgi:RNA polymerase sigma factor (sigma-70 family)